jgi:hypothetical protein
MRLELQHPYRFALTEFSFMRSHDKRLVATIGLQWTTHALAFG